MRFFLAALLGVNAAFAAFIGITGVSPAVFAINVGVAVLLLGRLISMGAEDQ